MKFSDLSESDKTQLLTQNEACDLVDRINADAGEKIASKSVLGYVQFSESQRLFYEVTVEIVNLETGKTEHPRVTTFFQWLGMRPAGMPTAWDRIEQRANANGRQAAA